MNEISDLLRSIFAKALDIESDQERAAYLADACGTNLTLRREVEQLIQAHVSSGPFLPERPAASGVGAALVEAAAGFKADAGTFQSRLAENPGDRIGRYKLLQQIGEGGMGTVYMAEQEEPVRRRVALKIIKLGMDTKQVVARFEAERQALALMDHPNIARVLDAGATVTGRPYFVMELVQGVPITEFCDKNRMPTGERIELFIPVCQAIQSAHQKGLIHRDLKPSNILITLNGGVPVPKVIDFGVAKAINQKLTEKTLFTNYGMMVGTPAYMSPEQAEMTSMDIDTRADIYSLGVLLYELLTGTTPFPEKRLRSAGYNEMQRIILEEEPERPSTRLSTMKGEQRSAVAKSRGANDLAFGQAFASDLDWIVMKCLEKDRGRRYETANGLAVDIRRHLDNEPVLARPPSAAYRFKKLVRRNKIAVAAVSAVAAALVIGLGISTWMFMRERINRQLASAAEQRAETVSQFLKDMLKGLAPSMALVRDTRMLQEILDKTVERVAKDLTNQPRVEAEMLSTIGNIYFELGQWQKAEKMHRDALRLRRAVFGETNEFVAASLSDLGAALIPRPSEAEKFKREALAMRKTLWTNDHPDVARSLISLSATLHEEFKMAEAEHAAREGLAMWRRLRPNQVPDPDVATSLNALGLVLSKVNKLAEAEDAQREALSIWRGLGEKESPDLATAYVRLAAVLKYRGKLDEAETTMRKALEMRRRTLGDNHPHVSNVFYGFVDLLERRGKLPEAEALCRDLLAGREKLFPEGSHEAAAALGQLAYILFKENKSEEAEASRSRSQDMLHQGRLSRVGVLKQLNRLSEAARENCAAYGIPAREADTHTNLVDLSAFYNAGFKRDWHENRLGNDLSELPVGIQELGGTRFDVRGLVQIASQQNGKERFPFDVTDVVIGRKCRLLHILHGIIWGTEDQPGTIIGKYVMHYSSGVDEERAIVLGKDALDWWTKPPEPGAIPSLTVAWSGENPWSRSRGETIQLYKTTWENPRPDDEIVSIDFVSGRKSAAPFLVAITVD